MRAVLLLVVMVAVAGCSSATEKTRAVAPVGGGATGVPTPTRAGPTVAATPGPKPTKAVPRRSPAKRLRIQLPSIGRFETAVQRQMPQFAVDRRDEEVAELGQIACRSLAAGKRDAVVAREITEYGVSARDARELVLLARDNACRLSVKS